MKKICVICNKEFESYDKPHHNNKHFRLKRPYRAKTCSKSCSRLYIAKVNKEKNKYYSKAWREKNKLKSSYAKNYWKEHYKNNKDKILKYQKEYYIKNKNKIRIQKRKRYIKKMEEKWKKKLSLI